MHNFLGKLLTRGWQILVLVSSNIDELRQKFRGQQMHRGDIVVQVYD